MKQLLHKALLIACGCAMSASAYAGQTAYGYLFGSKNDNHGFVTFDIDKPQNLTFAGSKNYGYVHPTAGEYVDGKIYTFRGELGDISEIAPHSWAIYDGETFKQLSYNYTSQNRVVDMTYDYTTNTMYAIAENRYNTGTVTLTTLCIVDMATGQLTTVGKTPEIYAIDGNGYNTEDGLITLACDGNGQLYAMSVYRTLYKVDKFTGEVTAAAPQHNLGTGEYFQSMAFAADGKLWWAQQHPSYGHFCEIDLATGIPGGFVDFRTDYDKLNKLGDDAQVTCLFFKDKEVRKSSPLAVTGFSAAGNDADIYAVDLKWTLPEKDYIGNAANVTGVKIYRLGKSEPVADLAAGVTSFTDTNVPDGTQTYEIIPYNADGNGFPAFAQVFAGMDQLNAVQNVAINLDDKTVTLTWDKPAATVNGGYADFNAITYNITRMKGDIATTVATAQPSTSFTETLDDTGSFYYVIEPICGGIVGKPAKSESVLISSIATIPYATGFEDDQDGSQWKIINRWGGNTGWSLIGNDSYAIDGKLAKAYTGGKANYGDDWFISPAIEFAAGDYVLEFDANGSDFDKQTLDILLGDDPDDTASFTQLIHAYNDEKVYGQKDVNKGWVHQSFDFTVAAPGIHHVAFYNKNKAIYAYFKLDNLKINSKSAGIAAVENDANGVAIAVDAGKINVAATSPIANVTLCNIQGQTLQSVDDCGCNAVIAARNAGIYIVSVSLSDGARKVAKVAVR